MNTDPNTEKAGLKPVAIAERIRGLVKRLLEDGASPSDIAYSLAFVATELGLLVAPEPLKVFPVVLDAVGEAAARHADREADTGKEREELNVPPGTTIH